MAAAACSSSSGSSSPSAQASGTPEHGGTITIEWPATPNFIFPLIPATNTDGYNANLQMQIWPYLVATGDGAQATVNPQASLYSSLTYSNNDQTITVVLKPWKWSDGAPITSRDSGPDRPYLSQVINDGFTSEDAAYDVLLAGGDITGLVPPPTTSSSSRGWKPRAIGSSASRSRASRP